MKLLSLETATPAGAAALVLDGVVAGEVLCTTSREHTETLLPAALELLAAADLSVGELDAVVVDLGPGLYTGLRVGVASARSLAMAAAIGLETVTSTEVLARDPKVAGVGRVLCCLDAARGEVFVELFVDAHSAAGPAVMKPEQVAGWCVEHGGVAEVMIGNATERHGPALEGVASRVVDQAYPSPAVAALMVEARGSSDADAAGAVPIYLRDPDAVANFQVAPLGKGR